MHKFWSENGLNGISPERSMEVLLMKKPCPLCMSLRAKFVRWLGVRLGVMEPIKEKPVEQKGFTQDQLAAIVGSKEMEIIALRLQLNALAQENSALKAKYESAPAESRPLEVVK